MVTEQETLIIGKNDPVELLILIALLLCVVCNTAMTLRNAYFSISCIYLKHHLQLCHLSTQCSCQKKKKKNGVPSNPETLVTSLLSHLALLTTKCYFFGEYDLWRSKEKCFTSEQMSLLRCHSSVFQYGWDGSVLDVPEEKVLCPEKPVRVSGVCCWRKKALGLEKVSCLSPQSKARPGLCECSTCSPR